MVVSLPPRQAEGKLSPYSLPAFVHFPPPFARCGPIYKTTTTTPPHPCGEHLSSHLCSYFSLHIVSSSSSVAASPFLPLPPLLLPFSPFASRPLHLLLPAFSPIFAPPSNRHGKRLVYSFSISGALYARWFPFVSNRNPRQDLDRINLPPLYVFL